MSVDWAATGDMLSGLGSVASAVAVVWAAHKASNTFEAWKRQKRAERLWDHAEKVLTTAYSAREALSFIRGRMMWAHEEYEARVKLEKEENWEHLAPDAKERLTTAQILVGRIILVQSQKEQLAETIPLAKVLFGDELEAAISKLHHQFWVLRTYVDAYAQDAGGDAAFTQTIRQNLWSSPEEQQGEISQDVRQAVKSIESICLPALRA